jgi:pimeloyl-ACP methyl ester carboxylesterase
MTSTRVRYRRRWRWLGVFAVPPLAFAAVLLVTPSSPAAAQCIGDCNGDHAVTIDELVTLVNIALDTAPPSACSLGVPTGAEVNIALIIAAVNSALNTCRNPKFRAITGVSMGAYGAMNLATKHPDLFGIIGALGGPIDLSQLLRDIVNENLDVKPQTAIPHVIGDPTTFDHELPYPGRDKRLSLFRDLVIAFGNPFLHHADATHQYLASDSEPAHIRKDDVFGAFSIPTNPRGFVDGGDTNSDGLRELSEQPTAPTDILLLAGGSLSMVVSGAQPVTVGERVLADLDGDGVFDVGDGIVINFSEPFTDTNHNFVFEPELGETFQDVGLDGVPGTGDFGEGNGHFDYDPDRAAWLAEDPLSRLAGRRGSDIARQRIFMDVGTQDEFGFSRHYDNFVAMLQAKGLPVRVEQGFPANCVQVPHLTDQFVLFRYAAGHIGIPGADTIVSDLLHGDFCGPVAIWQRLLTLIGYLNSNFPNGFYGPGEISLHPTGEVIEMDLPSPALAPSPDASPPLQHVLVYRPPAFAHSNKSFPIMYLLGGYGQSPGDFARLGDLFDVLILAYQVQNMFVAVLPGAGGHKGSFYVNHRVPESQVPDITPTSGRYEDSILQDLIPAIEHTVLNDRVRQQ